VAPFDLQAYLSSARKRIDARLAVILPDARDEGPLALNRAIVEAVLSGGKRLRPCITLAGCRAVGGDEDRALDAACAVELVHSYSLVHDDLPAMDDSAQRRGHPTCHRKYGEAAAILVGDALLTLAFEVIAGSGNSVLATRGARELAAAAGMGGMVGGQALDITLKNEQPAFEDVERCHAGKTAALFAASCALGGIAAKAEGSALDRLRSFGFDLGLAFQHADDLKDNEFPAHRARAHARVAELAERAGRTARSFADPGLPLAALADYVLARGQEKSFDEIPTHDR
jgi:geranylgeranyl pyrophosphate synthase